MEANRPESDYTQEIAELAYAYWEERGYEHGHDVEDWLQAEHDVQHRHAQEKGSRPLEARTAAR